MKAVLLICTLVSLAWGWTRGQPCIQEVDDFRSDPDDCTGYYRCPNSVLIWVTCSLGTVYNSDLEICVDEGGQMDTCKPSVEKYTVFDGTDECLIPDTKSCALYYDCEAHSRDGWKKNLQECPYPRVFNTENRKCEHYSMVDCGDRKLPLGKCDYKAELCSGSNCRSCDIDNPSCRGKPDGLNQNPNYVKGLPYYIVCVDQRLVYKDKCVTTSSGQSYNEKLRSCVHVKG